MLNQCPSFDRLEYFLRSKLNSGEVAEWEQHLSVCEKCRRLKSEHELVQGAFEIYRKDDFLTELAASWQPDLNALESQSSKNASQTENIFELVPLLPDPLPLEKARNSAKAKKPAFRFWSSVAAGLALFVVGFFVLLTSTGSLTPTAPGAVPTATLNAQQAPVFAGVIWADPSGQARPSGLALTQGTLYFSDAYRHTVAGLDLTKVNPTPQSWGGYGAQNGQFKTPQGLAITPEGFVLVADTVNHRIQKCEKTGQFIMTWGSYGSAGEKLNNPQGIAVAPNGVIYVADSENHRVMIYDKAGNYVASLGGLGGEPGEFNEPKGLAVDNAGNLYVADSSNARIQKFDNAGKFLMAWGKPGQASGEFSNLSGLAWDTKGYLYALDGNRIQKFSSNGEFLAATSESKLDNPQGIVADGAGNLYVADTRNSRIVKFKAFSFM